MRKTALIIGTDGSEDMELIISSDVLRRGDIDVTIVSIQDKPTIALARNAILQVDQLFKDVLNTDFDAVVLPGGPGYDKLCQDSRVGDVLRRHEAAGKIIAAICAAPTALKAHKIAEGATVTSYPTVSDQFTGYNYTDKENVCVWKNVVTSRGPGTAFEFALKLVELLQGTEVAKSVREKLLL